MSLSLLVLSLALPAADIRPQPVTEMRVYYAAPGKLDALHARFRDHTLRLFEKHGITNVGYFVPLGDNPENKLIYFRSFPSREAAETSSKAFSQDPEWKKAHAESEKDGKLVARVESTFMVPTDYSPEPLPTSASESSNRVFELRTYTATKGNLPLLNARFRDHTVKLFEKYGMTNIAYWNLMLDQTDADVKLVYLLAHQSREAAKQSFASFGRDPEWTKARTESEQKGGGSLTAKNGVVSEFLKPTDYSPLK